jgi:hypothetical protein
MGLRPATMHVNSLFDTKSFISNSDSGYFHGSEESAFGCGYAALCVWRDLRFFSRFGMMHCGPGMVRLAELGMIPEGAHGWAMS